jgi:glutaredoxin 3
MADVTVYTTDPCSFCVRTKELLAARGIEYTEVNLAKDADGRSELVARTGMMSFPQVLVGDRVIGGFREVATADSKGELEELLTAA